MKDLDAEALSGGMPGLGGPGGMPGLGAGPGGMPRLGGPGGPGGGGKPRGKNVPKRKRKKR